jgi:hypothetical protein
MMEAITFPPKCRLLVTANVVPSSPIPVTLMIKGIRSETLVLTRAAWCHVPEDGILHIRRRKNLNVLIAFSSHSKLLYGGVREGGT